MIIFFTIPLGAIAVIALLAFCAAGFAINDAMLWYGEHSLLISVIAVGLCFAAALLYYYLFSDKSDDDFCKSFSIVLNFTLVVVYPLLLFSDIAEMFGKSFSSGLVTLIFEGFIGFIGLIIIFLMACVGMWGKSFFQEYETDRALRKNKIIRSIIVAIVQVVFTVWSFS